jgi:hypothetical protein
MANVYGTLNSADGTRQLTIYADTTRCFVSITTVDGAVGFEIPANQATAQQVLNTIRTAMQSLWPGVS